MKKLIPLTVAAGLLTFAAIASGGYFTEPLPPHAPTMWTTRRSATMRPTRHCCRRTRQRKRRGRTSRCAQVFATRGRRSSTCGRSTQVIRRQRDGRGRSHL